MLCRCIFNDGSQRNPHTRKTYRSIYIVNSHLQLAVMVYFGAKIHYLVFLKNIEGWNLEPCLMLTPHFNTGGSITIPVGMQASRPNRNYASFK